MTDVTKLREGTVPDIEKKLAGLSDADLKALHDAEDGTDNPRSTLLDAIHVEQDKRKATEAEDDRPRGSDGTPIKQPGDSVVLGKNDEGHKARMATMSADFGKGDDGAGQKKVGQTATVSGR